MFSHRSLSKHIFHFRNGENYLQLFRFMGPEILTSLLLFSALTLVDAKLIADLGSHTVYATLGVTTSAFHLLVKVGESFMAATVILGGRFNGKKEYSEAGIIFVNTFWVALFIGFILSLSIYLLAPWYYKAHHFSPDIVMMGSTYLRLKAISIFLMFVYLSSAGFFKSIKNTRVPMMIFCIGASFFVFFDCLLIKGILFFPSLGLIGSAIASIIQYAIMVVGAFGYLLVKHGKSKYQIQLFNFPSFNEVGRILKVTWPVIIDKAALMIGYIWLGMMLSKAGSTSLASFTVLRDIMALACIPAQAASHVIGFLASNDAGRSHWKLILINIQKITWLTIAIIFLIYCVILYNAKYVVEWFDPSNSFSTLAIWAIFPLSVLVLGDILQLVLSGAMRGVGKVNYVMWIRLASVFGFFIPCSYWVSSLHIQNNSSKFLAIFVIFYLNFFIMSGCYLWLFMHGSWRIKNLESKTKYA